MTPRERAIEAVKKIVERPAPLMQATTMVTLSAESLIDLIHHAIECGVEDDRRGPRRQMCLHFDGKIKFGDPITICKECGGARPL